MRQTTGTGRRPSEKIVKDIKPDHERDERAERFALCSPILGSDFHMRLPWLQSDDRPNLAALNNSHNKDMKLLPQRFGEANFAERSCNFGNIG